MNEESVKTNYSDPVYNREFNSETTNRQYENQYGQQTSMPNDYNYRGYTDSFYDEYEDSAAGSFILGAIVGGVIGAAAALFLAPKTGKEMRTDFSTQAVQVKDKGIEISSAAKEKATEFTAVAKEKATEFTAVAKDKTDGVTKTIQNQSEQLVDKVKSMRSKNSVPMDDGTVSSEGEEATEFIEKVAEKTKEEIAESTEDVTATAEAFKEAVVGKGTEK